MAIAFRGVSSGYADASMTHDVVLPAEVAAGDLVIVALQGDIYGGTELWDAPAGWQAVEDNSDGLGVFVRRASAGDASSSHTFTITLDPGPPGARSVAWVAVAYSGDEVSIDSTSFATDVSGDATITTATLTSIVTTTMDVGIGATADATAEGMTPSGSFTSRATSFIGSGDTGASIGVADLAVSGTTTHGALSFTAQGTPNNATGVRLVLRERQDQPTIRGIGIPTTLENVPTNPYLVDLTIPGGTMPGDVVIMALQADTVAIAWTDNEPGAVQLSDEQGLGVFMLVAIDGHALTTFEITGDAAHDVAAALVVYSDARPTVESEFFADTSSDGTLRATAGMTYTAEELTVVAFVGLVTGSLDFGSWTASYTQRLAVKDIALAVALAMADRSLSDPGGGSTGAVSVATPSGSFTNNGFVIVLESSVVETSAAAAAGRASAVGAANAATVLMSTAQPTLQATADDDDMRVTLVATSTATWTGSTPLTVLFERSIDGGAWATVRNGGAVAIANPSGSTASVLDYEAPADVELRYRATLMAGAHAASVPSAIATVQLTMAANGDACWWLKDPLTAASNRAINVGPSTLQQDQTLDAGVFSPLGRSNDVVVSDVIRGDRFPLEVLCSSKDERDAIQALWESQRVLLLQAPVDGDQWYIRLLSRRRTRVTPTVTSSGKGRGPSWRFEFDAVEVDAPG